MDTFLAINWPRFLRPQWITGPIFDKELRVSSRRKRNYYLRFLYVFGLTILVAVIWHTVVKEYGASAFSISQMNEAGEMIISTVTVFQFVAAQLIAVVMLSTSISDEIYNRTLGVLMTTPVNSMQIVAGKLSSKLLQLVLLLAISLPFLTIIRVFGGVPWMYLISSYCITLTAVFFAGILSLYFSIHGRRAYAVIIKTLFVLGSLYIFIPLIVACFMVFTGLSAGGLFSEVLFVVLAHCNPLVAMQVNSLQLITAMATFTLFFWPAHCIVMLAASAFVLVRSIRIVRRVALHQAAGGPDTFRPRTKVPERKKKSTCRPAGSRDVVAVRPVKGSPIVWKELRRPLIEGGEGRNSIIGLAVTIIALFITYAVCGKNKCLDEPFVHSMYAGLFLTIGIIVNIVLSSSAITSEKESGTWSLLLATALGDWHILTGKAAGVLRRCLPIWFFMAGHVCLFVSLGYIHPILLFHLAVITASIILFLTGAGLYMSSAFKRTTYAVVASILFVFAFWFIAPTIAIFATNIYKTSPFVGYMLFNPLVQTGCATRGACEANVSLPLLEYYWRGDVEKAAGLLPTTIVLLVSGTLYSIAGVLMGWRAKRRIRRNIF